jgi:hypothetical protein
MLSKSDLSNKAANWYYLHHAEAFQSWYKALDHAESILTEVEKAEPEIFSQLLESKDVNAELREILIEFDVAYWEE